MYIAFSTVNLCIIIVTLLKLHVKHINLVTKLIKKYENGI
jgi:hypothetical protein